MPQFEEQNRFFGEKRWLTAMENHREITVLGRQRLHEKDTRHITHQLKRTSKSCTRIFKTATRVTKISLGFTEANRRGLPRAHRNAMLRRHTNKIRGRQALV